MDSDEWYSDEALRKQRELERLEEAGEEIPTDLLIGILEARVPPTEEECCTHCGSDARKEVGGEKFHGERWCWLCFSRGYHEDSSDTVLFSGDACPRCGGPFDNNYFDREVCPEPCNTMHTRCKACGCAINGCAHDTGRLRHV